MLNNLSLRKSAKKVFQALSVMAVLFSPAAALANPPSSDGWAMVFSDDFNGTTLDTNKWSTCYWWGTKKGCNNGGAKEVQWFQPDDVIVDNGILHLRAQKRSMNGYEYTSGMIASHDKYAFQYGYAEIRAKVPKGNGFWPTFWLGSQNKVWPPEIDIAEFIGSDMRNAHMTLHYADASNGSVKNSGGWWGGNDMDFSADYHTYAVQWSPEAIIWYIDGVERRRYITTENIPSHPMYLMATLALGQAWSKYLPDSTTPLPSTFDIDYIKVWRHNSSVSTKTVTPILSEAEELGVEAKSNASHLTFREDKLSGGVATILKATKASEYVTYTVNVPEARTFNVRVRVKKGNTRGMFQMSINGTDYGSVQDLYSSSSVYEELDLGNVTFNSPGNKSFKFTVTDKNASSKDYKLVFDYIKLVAK